MTCIFSQIQNSIVSSKGLVLGGCLLTSFSVIVVQEVKKYYATFLIQKFSQLNWSQCEQNICKRD